mgnify:CR=1 FL=1
MSLMQNIYERAKKEPKKVVFPEIDEPRISSAVARLEKEKIAEAIGLIEVSNEMVSALSHIRGVKKEISRRLLARPLIRAATMVALGLADVMVAGAENPTRRVIEAARLAIGLQSRVKIVSSFFLMLCNDERNLIFSDCAVNVAPSAEELVDIARSSASSAKLILGSANVALLSFSTGSSGQGKSVELVRKAAELSGFIGPIQADAALNSNIALKKGLGRGDANVLIFPTLDSGNIAYKLLQQIGGVKAIGPVLQGLRKPVCDLSRGASVEDIVDSTAVTLVLSKGI